MTTVENPIRDGVGTATLFAPKRSAVFDIITNGVPVVIDVDAA